MPLTPESSSGRRRSASTGAGLPGSSSAWRDRRCRTCAVIAFPLGAMVSAVKVDEARSAIGDGADELDMVMNIGEAKAGDWDEVAKDIAAVISGSGNVPVKVILETALLTPAEIVQACLVALDAGAQFVKTSSGFHGAGGATEPVVRLMRRTVGTRAGVKASGGVGPARWRFVCWKQEPIGSVPRLRAKCRPSWGRAPRHSPSSSSSCRIRRRHRQDTEVEGLHQGVGIRTVRLLAASASFMVSCRSAVVPCGPGRAEGDARLLSIAGPAGGTRRDWPSSFERRQATTRDLPG